MNIIKNAIKSEQAKDKPDNYYLKVLNKLLTKNEVTFEDFSNTGKIIPLEVFKKHYSSSDIHPECTDVVVYLCGFYIQMLKSGRYIHKFRMSVNTEIDLEHETLDVVEVLAWNNFISNQFN